MKKIFKFFIIFLLFAVLGTINKIKNEKEGIKYLITDKYVSSGNITESALYYLELENYGVYKCTLTEFNFYSVGEYYKVQL